MPLRVFRLDDPADAPFPPAELALDEPDGLLAVGGCLRPERLLNAYRGGIFPWFSEGEPILWWSPSPRMVFPTDGVHLSTRFRRTLRKSHWVVRADTAFDRVIDACADTPREGQDGTWITTGMKDAYRALHRLGFAHSIEVWDGDRLVGGLYGVAIGRMFFAESMVSLATGGSKVALAALAHHLHAWGWPVIDAQLENPHLLRMGGQRWPRERFLAVLRAEVGQAGVPGPWTDRVGAWPAAALAAPPG